MATLLEHPGTTPHGQRFVKDPGQVLAQRTVWIKLRLGSMGTLRKINPRKANPNVDGKLIRVYKVLLRSRELEAVRRLDGEIRRYLYDTCLPFGVGIHLVPLSLLETVDARLKEFGRKRERLIEQFVKAYPRLCKEAAVRLGDFYRRNDYPDRIESHFSFAWQYLTLGVPDQLKVISGEIFQKQRAIAQEMLSDAAAEITQVMRVRLAEMVNHLEERLTPGQDGKRKILREGAVTELQKYLDSFDFRNVMDDKELKTEVEKLRGLLKGTNVQELRQNVELRRTVRDGLEEIASSHVLHRSSPNIRLFEKELIHHESAWRPADAAPDELVTPVERHVVPPLARASQSEVRDAIARDACPAREFAGVIPSPKSNAERDPVDCTVYAPRSLGQGEAGLIQIYAHMPERTDEAAKLALEMDEETSRAGRRSLGVDIARGTTLSFSLILPGLEVDDPVQSLVWRGRTEAVQFGVTVPSECQLGVVIGRVTVALDSVPLGHIKFKLMVRSSGRPTAGREAKQVGDEAHRYTMAFVSYASPDRVKVLARVQMLKPLGVDYFQDVLDLEPGTRFEPELYRHIDECDLFLLFWSSAASKSEWVLKEVRHALARKRGDDFAPPEIYPVIIEGPPIVPPPPELAHLHFNDRVLYFMSPAAQSANKTSGIRRSPAFAVRTRRCRKY